MPVQRMPNGNLVAVQLRRGPADWRAFAARWQEPGGAVTFTSPGDVMGVPPRHGARGPRHPIDVLALIIFGLLVALITLLFVGQAMGRHRERPCGRFGRPAQPGCLPGSDRRRRREMAGLVGIAGAALAVAVAFAHLAPHARRPRT